MFLSSSQICHSISLKYKHLEDPQNGVCHMALIIFGKHRQSSNCHPAATPKIVVVYPISVQVLQNSGNFDSSGTLCGFLALEKVSAKDPTNVNIDFVTKDCRMRPTVSAMFRDTPGQND